MSQQLQEQGKGFFGALFDFSFKTYITTKLIKVIFGLVIVLAGLGTLVFIIGAFVDNVAFGVVSLIILGPLYFLVTVVIWRVCLEVVMNVFTIAENTTRMVALMGGTPPPHPGSTPPPFASGPSWTPPPSPAPVPDPSGQWTPPPAPDPSGQWTPPPTQAPPAYQPPPAPPAQPQATMEQPQGTMEQLQATVEQPHGTMQQPPVAPPPPSSWPAPPQEPPAEHPEHRAPAAPQEGDNN